MFCISASFIIKKPNINAAVNRFKTDTWNKTGPTFKSHKKENTIKLTVQKSLNISAKNALYTSE